MTRPPTAGAPTSLPTTAEAAALRLVAVDLDGTLLGHGVSVDPRFWSLADRLEERGVQLCAASGRQRHTLVEVFGGRLARMSLICDNGAFLEHRGQVLHAEVLGTEAVARTVRGMRDLPGFADRLAIAVSGPGTVLLETPSDAVAARAAGFFHSVVRVPDVLEGAADALKVSVYSADGVDAALLEGLHRTAPGYAVVQGHDHWADVTGAGTDKGAALRRLQLELGVTREQTAAFGDHLNDLGMLAAAGVSFAMGNAHPRAAAAARFRAPANTEAGVVRVLEELLDLMGPGTR
ncbi:HAD family hydrolase [Isoptericola sp. b441]|uniref:HAD family hydrolase n=1 Tax=Actinotalea lenta TaxID=3064654 RepID=A0ABT9D6H9_9CELL|nr:MULTISPECIES: HAD family hydrolase [unclassified Isoptericola]MDO8106444.1 HAD family hydrolase [Isoptericola sp. b441]MDO8121840.1 HAD family hydrolase [Isoptericola sp. b490]